MSREHEYLEEWFPDGDEDDFFLKVRIESAWDEAHFRRMVRTADALLDEIEASGQLDPARRDAGFTSVIANLTMLLRHPGFLAENDLGLDREAYRAYIEERIARLAAIRARYEALRARLAPGTPG